MIAFAPAIQYSHQIFLILLTFHGNKTMMGRIRHTFHIGTFIRHRNTGHISAKPCPPCIFTLVGPIRKACSQCHCYTCTVLRVPRLPIISKKMLECPEISGSPPAVAKHNHIGALIHPWKCGKSRLLHDWITCDNVYAASLQQSRELQQHGYRAKRVSRRFRPQAGHRIVTFQDVRYGIMIRGRFRCQIMQII